MPIVTAYCRVKDGQGADIKHPQVFLKVRGLFYRTHIKLDSIYAIPVGWTGHAITYRGLLTPDDGVELKELAESMLSQSNLKDFAVDGSGLKHCGIRFVF